MIPFKSHMVDEILVEYTGANRDSQGQYEITSHPHRETLGELAGKPKKQKKKYVWNEDDLMLFKQLGYAVCNNTLDCHGKKVYIHHNIRTFKEGKKLISTEEVVLMIFMIQIFIQIKQRTKI